MSQNLKPVISIIALIFVGFFFFQWKKKVSGRRRTPEEVATERRAYEEQLLHPDWAFYERHLQRPVPAALRALYADRALIVTQSLDYPGAEGISTFEALNEQRLLETRSWLGFDAVAIATSESGDAIYLRPGSTEPDKVYITYHDAGEDDTDVFAESVAILVEKLKQANQPSKSA